MKLDAGDAETLRHVNASAADIDAIVEALASMPGIVVQAMFVRERQGRVDNTTQSATEAWLRAITRIRPLAVHLYTLARAGVDRARTRRGRSPRRHRLTRARARHRRRGVRVSPGAAITGSASRATRRPCVPP